MTTNVVIIEDEQFAAEKLERQLGIVDADFKVVRMLESVSQAVSWLKENKTDLIFLDIHLADGLCFRIFDEVEIKTPIIFTTAYDQYAIQAFKVNSVDYLLKPINKFDLAQSIEKFKAYHNHEQPVDYSALLKSLKEIGEKEYQKRFMVVHGDSIKTIQVDDVAYFFAEGKYAFLVTKEGKEYLIDFTLERLTSKLNPDDFFRVNRQVIVRLDCIKEMHSWFKRRIKLDLQPSPSFTDEVIVSAERIKDFKEWLNR